MFKYFKKSEFDSPDIKGSGDVMNDQFLLMLDEARELASTPFKITSGYRSPEYNKRIGGVSDSAHIKGLAADIYCPNSATRSKILNSLILVGFNRIGIGRSFIHVDNDMSKDQNVIWTYYK